MSGEFSHFDHNGNAVMVDVSGKESTFRVAVAEGTIKVSKEIMEAVTGNRVKKGDVLGVARVAGINLYRKGRRKNRRRNGSTPWGKCSPSYDLRYV